MVGKVILRVCLVTVLVFAANAAMADTFGTLGNQFTIDFVPISGAMNPTDTSLSGGYGIVNNDYRMGTCEITNEQWNKFKAAYGSVVGNPGYAYYWNSSFTGANLPTNNVSWYEAAQFVNWLNTSMGHQAAYKFTGTKGTWDYTFATWIASDTGYAADNPYRNKAAKYFLPTEDEWVKAAYWNGATLQDYATKPGESLTQGSNGTSGVGWNYGKGLTNPDDPWAVQSGSQELNGTYDMMGNVWEWMEGPRTSGDYGASSWRGIRGGSWANDSSVLVASNCLSNHPPFDENPGCGFRVASVPEPGSLTMLLFGLALTALLCWWRKRA